VSQTPLFSLASPLKRLEDLALTLLIQLTFHLHRVLPRMGPVCTQPEINIKNIQQMGDRESF
jgi:hypothetical protein